MTLLTPIAMLLLLPFTAFCLWYLQQSNRVGAMLPGSWRLVTTPSLRQFMQRRLKSGDDKSIIVAAVCSLLVIATLAHPVIAIDTAPPANFTGRVVVLDMSAGIDVEAQRFFADSLLVNQSGNDAASATATGLVLAGDGAYTVVPVTQDMAHVQRYTGVATPDLMPANGRTLHEGIAVAESLLADAEVAVGQVVIVTSGTPLEEFIAIPDRGRLRDIVVADGESQHWSGVADSYRAQLHASSDLAAVVERLSSAARDRFFRGVQESTFDLRPPLIALALVLWLWLLRRRIER